MFIFQSVAALFVLFAAAHAGLLAPAANVLQGPSARATVAGPDGSVISSVAPGGSVVSDVAPGYAAYAAPAAVAAPAVAAYAAPAVAAYSAPAFAAYSAPAVAAYAAPAVAAYAAPYAAPVAYAAAPAVREDTVISGPSGTIASSRAAPGAFYY